MLTAELTAYVCLVIKMMRPSCPGRPDLSVLESQQLFLSVFLRHWVPKQPTGRAGSDLHRAGVGEALAVVLI